MTEEEEKAIRNNMNAFLKRMGGLKNGYYSDREPIDDSYFFSVGLGWFPLLKRLIKDLIDLGWNKEICQVKEKFGGLRFYINSASEEVFRRISEAEEESFKTCEVCGEPGKIVGGGWIKVLCEKCQDKKEK